MRPQTIPSRHPGKWEMEQTGGVFAEQVIRPTASSIRSSRSARRGPRSTICSAR